MRCFPMQALEQYGFPKLLKQPPPTLGFIKIPVATKGMKEGSLEESLRMSRPRRNDFFAVLNSEKGIQLRRSAGHDIYIAEAPSGKG